MLVSSKSSLFVSFRFVSFRFVSFRFVSFRFVSLSRRVYSPNVMSLSNTILLSRASMNEINASRRLKEAASHKAEAE